MNTASNGRRMIRRLVLGALCAVGIIGLPAIAAVSDYLRSDAPSTYTVVKGDTLWDISGRFLEQPWLWPEIWQVNPQIENPHLILPR